MILEHSFDIVVGGFIMVYIIKSKEKWKAFSDKFHSHGWKLWQMQYYWDLPEGFHAWFWLSGKEDIEIVTYNEDVQRAIVKG